MINSPTSTKTIVVAGATGNIGGQLLTELAANGDVRVRATTRNVGSAALPEGVEPFQADLRHADSLRSAFTGATALFLVSRIGVDADILSLARRAGIEHVVLVSSITVRTHPHLGPAQENAAVERLLESSGVGWTILRPTQFASNALWWADSIRESRGLEIPFADIGLPTVHPGDIARVAYAALTEPGHHGQRYALTGPELITPRQQVAAIAAALGDPVSVTEISRTRARARMVPEMGERLADALLDVTGGDTSDELLKVRDTVTRIVGRPAQTFQQWVSQHVSAFQ
ncbi:NAD(P)H-binding protein [Nocardia uniformis]|uniref:NAD(P)H-binding protein n=1 Tax=Nocardia uniformis TaxID=53432 RepID=A0A849C193_9NOCA|nr:NAD(P)H-binding protein [Nocardia uniformis]NNH70125.1 NAD(P)H-binding protein [Nocardia uniformis]